jgi:hypothetical protein
VSLHGGVPHHAGFACAVFEVFDSTSVLRIRTDALPVRVQRFCPWNTGHESRIMPRVFSCAGDSTRRKRNSLSSTGHRPRITVHESPLLTSSPIPQVPVLHLGTRFSSSRQTSLPRAAQSFPSASRLSPLAEFFSSRALSQRASPTPLASDTPNCCVAAPGFEPFESSSPLSSSFFTTYYFS